MFSSIITPPYIMCTYLATLTVLFETVSFAKPQTKEQFIQYVNNLHENSNYFSVKNTKSSYPDAVEYKDENFSGVTWIYSWEYWTAVGGTTGIDNSQLRSGMFRSMHHLSCTPSLS